MTLSGRVAFGVGVVLLVVAATPPSAAAQAPTDGPRAGARQGGGVSVVEAERLFNRYMLGQARVALQLSPDQLVRFGQRFERLQALQRQRQRQRQRRLAELAALGRGGRGVDEAAVTSLLQSIDAEAAAADERVRAGRQRLEEVLSVGQRARFRAFEARMEREKLRLISRARAEARAGSAGAGGPEDDADMALVAPQP